jgi:hypothetical protein
LFRFEVVGGNPRLIEDKPHDVIETEENNIIESIVKDTVLFFFGKIPKKNVEWVVRTVQVTLESSAENANGRLTKSLFKQIVEFKKDGSDEEKSEEIEETEENEETKEIEEIEESEGEEDEEKKTFTNTNGLMRPHFCLFSLLLCLNRSTKILLIYRNK